MANSKECGMGRKRYYYDSKGRSRGHSSDESPQARNVKALLFGLPIVAVIGMCSGESKDTEREQTKVVSQQHFDAEGTKAVNVTFARSCGRVA